MQLLNDLVELAKKATPGEWFIENWNEIKSDTRYAGGKGVICTIAEYGCTDMAFDHNLAYLSEVTPAAILAIAEYVNGLENHIATAGRMMGWVKCSERMPEDATMVLLRCGNDYDFGMLIGGEMKVFSVDKWKILPGAVITHWMPLPEAPHD